MKPEELKILLDRLARLEHRVRTLENTGARAFQDADTIVKRNLYAEKVYTKRSGKYVELTS